MKFPSYHRFLADKKAPGPSHQSNGELQDSKETNEEDVKETRKRKRNQEKDRSYLAVNEKDPSFRKRGRGSSNIDVSDGRTAEHQEILPGKEANP
jgi:hypothetical protein